MKILHLLSTFSAGGIERWLLGILPYIDLEKYQMEFYCRFPEEGVLVSQVRSNGGIVHHHKGHRLNLFSYVQGIKDLHNKHKYDIIHNHLAHHGGIPARTYSKLTIPSIASFHNARLAPLQFGNYIKKAASTIYTKASLKLMVDKAQIVTGCSSDVLSSLEPVVTFKNSDARVLHYGVDIPEKLSEDQIKSFKISENISPDKKIIVHVGSFTHQKNHRGLLDISKKIIDKRKDVVIVLVGVGELLPSIKQYAIELGIIESIKFMGLRNDVERIFSCSDVFLFPSFFEGLPVACLEALAAGLPVVGSNVPGIKLLVKNGETGYLCEPNDTEEFVNKLTLILDDLNLKFKISENSRSFIAKNFSYQSSSQNLTTMYDEIDSFK